MYWCFFFFRQKAAYEMRISDWSSDVCSSDLLRALESSEAEVRVAALTPREQEVLEGLANGLPNKTIAYDLGCSSRTVEVHRASLMAKLEVRNLSEALRIAFAAGMGR